MTIIDEGRQIRAEVAKLRPDKRRRYSAELKTRILAWVRRATAAGMDLPKCGHALGIRTWRFRSWQREEPEPAPLEVPASEVLALVPIEVDAFAAAPPVLVTPSGYRVEGLSLAQIALLLRELA
jgi:hypothetical protein